MGLYRSLYDISKMLQSTETSASLTGQLMERIVAFTGACKAFLVAEQDGEFVERHQIHFGDDAISNNKRLFSRSLVREAVEQRESILTIDCSEHEQFDESVSLADFGHASVLVTPLIFKGEVFAVIYLERNPNEGPFGEEARLFMREVESLANVAIYRMLKPETRRDQLSDRYNFEDVIHEHDCMVDLLETVGLVAQSDATTLIRGETGTGKEVIARAIFKNSSRNKGPFVTLHCGALPETLFESELFGHTRGAFTGANRDRVGRISQANGGTLFIDEVAEIPPSAQAKLLRFFQFNEIQKIGSDRVERVDVRVIAATHSNLEQMVAEGRFRQDLYYRLNVVELEIPPLRERRSDIPLLTDFFFRKYWKHKHPWSLEADARMALEHFNWPGNVRELGHVIERVCVLARDGVVSLDLLPRQLKTYYEEQSDQSEAACMGEVFEEFSNEELKTARENVTKKAVEAVEKTFITGLLKSCQGNVAEAAKRAGMHRTYLYKLLARYKAG